MKVVPARVEILTNIDAQGMLKAVEIAGRTCYKSEDKISADSAEKFVRGLIKHGHEAMIEHASITVKLITSRLVTHQIVRHRMAAYAQESQRYCRYTNKETGEGDVEFILPCNIAADSKAFEIWRLACEAAEKSYEKLLWEGVSPQAARTVLPNSTKTELVMTANMREWRHFFKLRTAQSADPAIRQVAWLLLKKFLDAGLEPFFFDIKDSVE